jgi:hypothetical protein
MGLADGPPGGANYPASDLNPDAPKGEYAKDANALPNPTGRLVVPEGA